MTARTLLPVASSLFFSALAAAAPPDFATEIQPLLEANCYACHGKEAQMGQLRLDAKSNAFRGGQSGQKGITAHDPAASELYRRVAGIGDQARMPMGKELPAEDVAKLKAWIEAGATWPDGASEAHAEIAKHWAFVPPRRPSLPTVQNKAWARNPIDRFVLAGLEKEGLKPSPRADRTTLIRRMSLDVVGLPPLPAHVDKFLADDSGEAYAKHVDRLLGTAHYGERWGRLWLDAARYADSDGFEKDKPRSVWFYRDWVVNALNRDMGYDQFVIEQIAGDLLPNPTQDQRVATGFLRNSMINEEGGIDPEQFRMEAMFDRIDAVGKSILGITIQCAQCHNHKFDPLTQEEYYKLFAFLNESHEANIAVYTPDDLSQRNKVLAAVGALEQAVRATTPGWRERMHAWANNVRGNQPKWTTVQPAVDDISTGGQKYIPMDDGSFLAQGYAPTKHTGKFTIPTDVEDITGFRLELLNDPNLPLGGPGRSTKGTGALSEFNVEVACATTPDDSVPVKWASATADIDLPERPLERQFWNREPPEDRVTGPITYAIDGDEKTAWSHDSGPATRNLPRKAVFVPKRPVEGFAEGTVLTFLISQRHGGWNSDDNQNQNLGRFRLSVTTEPNPTADPLPVHVREIVERPTREWTPADEAVVFSYWRTVEPGFEQANDTVTRLLENHPEPHSQLVLQEREAPRGTSLLQRGDFLKPVKLVQPGTPSFLHELDEPAEHPRLTFAKWLVSDDSPTTARTIVNRIWQAYFGRGLVTTPEDLGTQAPAPSHPELLDWLAVELMENDWSLKHIHRLIVNSATYQQSSRVTPDLLERDPYNRLLARGSRFRLDAEIIRDSALAASGLLDTTVGGPPVYPPAPRIIFLPPTSYGPKVWDIDTGGDRYRRSLYTFRFRSVPYPMLQTFDAPTGESAVVKRNISNSPLQALTLLNEQVFLEAARAMARHAVRSADTDASRIAYAFRHALTRKPRAAETDELLSLLEKSKKRYSDGDLDPWAFLGASPDYADALPAGHSPAHMAAWTHVARVLLNLDETITRE